MNKYVFKYICDCYGGDDYRCNQAEVAYFMQVLINERYGNSVAAWKMNQKLMNLPKY